MELLCQQDTKEAPVTQHLTLLIATQPKGARQTQRWKGAGEENFMFGKSLEFKDVSLGSRLCPSAKEPNALQ